MSKIPEEVRMRLEADCFRRIDVDAVQHVFSRLQVVPPEAILAFYCTFRGPFGSRKTSYTLLDVLEQNETIETATTTCREEFSFPREALVLTDLNANAVLVCDTRSGAVYDVDFEGGEVDFVEGRLPARWNSFEEFLCFYFG